MDNDTNISFLKDRVAQFVQERNWEQSHNPKNLSMSIAVEAAELMEIFQWKAQHTPNEVKADEKTMLRVKEELADVMIYAIDLANCLDIDISSAVLEKIEKNSVKYPKH